MDKPIGWWLKHLDGLIEAAFDDALAGVGRRQWQVLAALADGGGTERLRPFGEAEVRAALAALAARGWVDDERLTEAGRAAHAEIALRVAELRRRTAEGVTAEQYGTTLATLERMAANLGG